MGRKYKAPMFLSAFDTANNTMVSVVTGSGKVTLLRGFRIEQSSDYGDAAAEGLRIQLLKGTAGGGNGTVITAVPLSPSDPAFAGTVRADPDAITTTTILAEFGMNIQAGVLESPPEGWGWEISGTTVFGLLMVTDPGDAIDFEVTLDLEEFG